MATTAQPQSKLLAYLQLMRLPNVFTAMADVAMGFLFTHPSLKEVGELVLLVLSSSFLYSGGMVLNDLFDYEIDRRERPQRPLPSGRISTTTAARLGWSLVCWGIAAGWGTAILAQHSLPGFTATVVAALVVAYDTWAKHHPAGAIAMGACRAANVLLGMSASPLGLSMVHALVAGGIGVYVAGLTLFARREAASSHRAGLSTAATVMAVGLAALIAAPFVLHEQWPFSAGFVLHSKNWLVLWSLIVAIVGWRFLMAIVVAEPFNVQAAVKSGILGLIVFDAAVVYGVHGIGAAIGILLLMVPAVLLGRWVYST